MKIYTYTKEETAAGQAFNEELRKIDNLFENGDITASGANKLKGELFNNVAGNPAVATYLLKKASEQYQNLPETEQKKIDKCLSTSFTSQQLQDCLGKIGYGIGFVAVFAGVAVLFRALDIPIRFGFKLARNITFKALPSLEGLLAVEAEKRAFVEGIKVVARRRAIGEGLTTREISKAIKLAEEEGLEMFARGRAAAVAARREAAPVTLSRISFSPTPSKLPAVARVVGRFVGLGLNAALALVDIGEVATQYRIARLEQVPEVVAINNLYCPHLVDYVTGGTRGQKIHSLINTGKITPPLTEEEWYLPYNISQLPLLLQDKINSIKEEGVSRTSDTEKLESILGPYRLATDLTAEQVREIGSLFVKECLSIKRTLVEKIAKELAERIANADATAKAWYTWPFHKVADFAEKLGIGVR